MKNFERGEMPRKKITNQLTIILDTASFLSERLKSKNSFIKPYVSQTFFNSVEIKKS